MSDSVWSRCRGGKSCTCFTASSPAPVANAEPEVQEAAPFWRRALMPVVITLVSLLVGWWLVDAMIYAYSDHSAIVTVCDVTEDPWGAERNDTYDFETSDGDFRIVHPDGAEVQRGKVYEFKWSGNGPLTSFDEVDGATPDRCE